MSSEFSRREFIGTAAIAGTAVAVAARSASAMSVEAWADSAYTKARVLRVFLNGNVAWPKPDLDSVAEIKAIKAGLDKVVNHDEIEFLEDATIKDAKSLEALLAKHKDVDGILAIPVGMGISPMLNMLADSGIPTISFATPYSGHEWCIVPSLRRSGKKIDVIATSRYEDVLPAMRVFKAIHRLRETKILFVSGGPPAPAEYVAEAKRKLGVDIVLLDHKRLVQAFEAIPEAAARAEAEQWIKGAQKVVEPNIEEITKSARLCMGMQNVMAAERAQAITINCLGLFGQGGLPAYPCFGFTRLNDLGLIGVCEADLPSTLTQVIYQSMEGVPGFVTDPVFDTSNSTLIHAHCVSATKMDGPRGKGAPYVVRSHLEDYKGAVLQVKMRIGQPVTMAKLVTSDPRAHHYLAASPIESYGLGTMLVSGGTIVDVPDSDRGCRTQITVKVANAQRMLDGWNHGLHRVIFYGDHLADTRRLCHFLGISVLEEGAVAV